MIEIDEDISQREEGVLLSYLIEPTNQAERRMKAAHQHYPHLSDPLGSIAMHIGRKYYEARAVCISLGGEAIHKGGYELLNWPESDEALQAQSVFGDIDGDMHKFFYMSFCSGYLYKIIYDSEVEKVSVLKIPLQPVNPRVTYDADQLDGLFRYWRDLLENLDRVASEDPESLPEIQFSNS